MLMMMTMALMMMMAAMMMMTATKLVIMIATKLAMMIANHKWTTLPCCLHHPLLGNHVPET